MRKWEELKFVYSYDKIKKSCDKLKGFFIDLEYWGLNMMLVLKGDTSLKIRLEIGFESVKIVFAEENQFKIKILGPKR